MKVRTPATRLGLLPAGIAIALTPAFASAQDAAKGTTDLDRLALLCWPHHRQVDLDRWDLTRNPDPTGPYWRVTPTPRHRWRSRN